MRKLIALFLTIVLALSVTACLAETHIVVTGSGETLVPADTAIVSIGVNVRKKEAPKAQAGANEIIAKIREALTGAGLAEEDINTGYINLYGVYDYSSDSDERLIGYNASSTLSIRVTDMSRVGEVIDLAFGAGANTLDGVSFSVTDDTEARKAALRQAVEDAQTKAGVLVEAAGFTDMEIESIQEGGVSSYDTGYNNFSLKAARNAVYEDSAETVVRAAKIGVTATVTITFIVK